MTTFYDFLTSPGLISAEVPAADVRPLTGRNELHEAQVLDVRFHALNGSFGVLFELRETLGFDPSDSALLICEGVEAFSWVGPDRGSRQLTAWGVASSVPQWRDNRFHFELNMWPAPGATLRITCRRAAFVEGVVEGFADTQPSYSDVPAGSLVSGVASWDSPFTPKGVSWISANGGRAWS